MSRGNEKDYLLLYFHANSIVFAFFGYLFSVVSEKHENDSNTKSKTLLTPCTLNIFSGVFYFISMVLLVLSRHYSTWCY
jgi:hypothetical protein